MIAPAPSDSPVTQLSLVRQLSFCAGHRLLGHEGKCAFFHGHNYRVDLEVAGDTVDAVGRLIDFSVLKRLFQGWLDEHWDHGFLLHEEDENALAAIRLVTPTKWFTLPYNPTAENMARYLLEVVAEELLRETPVRATRSTVWETDESYAVATCRRHLMVEVRP
jgi:6-pyruvoyltetrahydropterin/6-carboxytetrahydropterin synthase